MPFKTTRVIPEGWSAHHQPSLRTSMNARCVITDPARAAPGEWDDETGTYGPSVPYQVYPDPADPDALGLCRLQRIQSAAQNMQAGQQIEYRDYLITIPADAPTVHTDYLVKITAAVNDAQAVGQLFTITDVMLGSERFERDLVVTHNNNQ